MAHLDSLIFGTSFVSVGTGDEGEPNPLVTPHSPQVTTGSVGLAPAPSRRPFRWSLTAQIVEATLYLPDQTFGCRGGNRG
jgi:hypothetical protein